VNSANPHDDTDRTGHSGESTPAGNASGYGRLRRSPLAVASVAAAVLIAGGGGAYLATSASGSDHTTGADSDPPALVLDRLDQPVSSPSSSAPSPSAPNGIAPGEPNPYGTLYRAKGALPEGPESAPVYRASGTVAAADVARLAKALGVAGTPRGDATTWKVGTEKDGSGPLLQVQKQAPGAWTYTRFRAPGGDNCLKGRSCPNVAPTQPGGGSGAAVSEDAAKKAAAPVLKALGQDDAKLDASRLLGAVRLVNAAPVVGGLPTYGWTTGIQVGADGALVTGAGQLDTPRRGAEYPVIGAAEALKQLNGAREGRGPGSGSGSGSGAKGGSGGCATAMPLTGTERDNAKAPCAAGSGDPRSTVDVGDAVFGLAAESVEGRLALVPSWLFEAVPGGGAKPYTVTQPAVDPAFLKPAPGHREMPGGPSPVGPDKQVTSYSTDSGGRTLTVRCWGGVCGHYAARADESGTDVKVKVTEVKPDPKQVCVAMAKEQTVKTTLDKPLGDRKVINGGTGERVPLAKT
jgi:hypothetical protein